MKFKIMHTSALCRIKRISVSGRRESAGMQFPAVAYREIKEYVCIQKEFFFKAVRGCKEE